MTYSKAIITTLLLAAIGLAVRVISAHSWQGLLFDEIASVAIALEPLSRIWDTLRWEMNPPLHFFYLKGWMHLFGTSEFMIRLSSALIGTLSVFALFMLGRRITRSPAGGVYAALVTTLAAIPLFYSVLARMYGMLFLFTALSMYFLICMLETAPEHKRSMRYRWYVVGYILSLTAALYTHLTALALPLVFLIYTLYVHFKHPERGVRIPFIIATLISGLAYLPWFINFVTARLSRLGGNAWYIYAQARDLFFLTLPNRFLAEGAPSQFFEIGVFVFFALIITAGVFTIKRIRPSNWELTTHITPYHILGVLLLYVPMVLLFAFQLHSLRYYTVCIVGLVTLIALGLTKASSKLIPRKMIITLAVVFLLPPSFAMMTMPPVAWPDVATFIEERERPGDRVITAYTNDLLATNYYYNGSLPIEAFVPADAPQRDEFGSELEFVIRTNANVYVSSENIEELGEMVTDSERIFFVFDSKLFGDTHELFIDWFLDNGWKRTDALESTSYTHISTWLMEPVK